MKRWEIRLKSAITYQMEVKANTRHEAKELAEEIWCQSENPDSEFNGTYEGVYAEYADEITE